MPLSGPSRWDSDGADPADPDAVDRLRCVRDRLEAVVFGLGELEYLRERQEAVVRAALEKEEDKELRRRTYRSSEESVLVLRKQLSCLRRKDAALITQFQELDQQISDLRLDAEASHDQLETDSRPSSGFYELSDGTSGSLSNSSHSVFSECFCPAADIEGHFPSTEERVSCLDSNVLVGGLCDDLSPFAAVHRSLSAPPPPPMEATSSHSQSKPPSNPLARNIYCYLSPLRNVAIQSSVFQQTFSSGARSRDDAGAESLKPESTPPSEPVPDPQTSSSQKNMDSYIYGLLQRRAQPIRTSRPRTSVSTDPSKNLQQQAALCVRQAFGPSPGFGTRGSERKPCRPTEEQKADVIQQGLKISCTSSPGTCRCSVSNSDVYRTTNSLTRKRSRGLPHSAGSVAVPQKDLQRRGPPTPHSAPKDKSCCSPHQELLLKSSPLARTKPHSPKKHTDPVQGAPAAKGERSSLVGGGGGGGGGRRSSSSSRHCPSKQNSVKLCRRNKTMRNITKTVLVSENNGPPSDRRREKRHHRPSSRKFQVLENGASTHIRVSQRGQCVPASILEGQVSDKNTTAAQSTVQSSVVKQHHHGNRHHHHGRSQAVVVKPKIKRSNYRQLYAIMEVPSDGAVRRARRRERKEVLCSSGSNMYPPSRGQCGGYAAGSDSEYSAECVSLFHSTIVDSSEDEKSNYTTNCFGDGESSEEEESSTSSGTEESVGGGAGGQGRRWGRSGSSNVGVGVQDMNPAHAKGSIKVKASYNLKKKILRFKSGSLKLMTTV